MIGLSARPDHSSGITPLSSATQNPRADGRALEGRPSETPMIESQATATPQPSASPYPAKTQGHAVYSTQTPVQVVVSTSRRSWVFYDGPSLPVRSDALAPLALKSFPRPANDNGRGLHWFPTTRQTKAVVDRFIPELVAMRIRWVVVLQGMNDWDLVANDYLIEQLNGAGIMTVLRVVSPIGEMDYRRLGWIVARYRDRGVRYFQIFNEPNVVSEWGNPALQAPEPFAAQWAQAAEVVVANGGLPGLAPMSPRADDSDLAFFNVVLQELKRAGRYDLLNLMWIGVHNYGSLTANGFWRYRRYDAMVKQILGASLPMIATEGGMETADATAALIKGMFSFVEREREPYLFAFAPWLIGNSVGGGHDPIWESSAWFVGTLDRVQPRQIVEQVKSTTTH